MNEIFKNMHHQMVPSEKTVQNLIDDIKTDKDKIKNRNKKLLIPIISAAASVVLIGIAVWGASSNGFSGKIGIVQNSTISDVSMPAQSQASIQNTSSIENTQSSTAAASSSVSNQGIKLSLDQLNALGTKYYPAPVKRYETSPATWETYFELKELIKDYKKRDFYACAYVTVLGTTTGELSHKEGTLGGMTYFEYKVDKVVLGDLKEGQTVVVFEHGYYDESTDSWVNTHPNFIPLKAGDKFLTIIYSAIVGNVKSNASIIPPFNGYVEEINGKTYLVYRSSPDIPASSIGKSLGREDLFTIYNVPSKLYENQTEEIALIEPAAMEQIIKSILAKDKS